MSATRRASCEAGGSVEDTLTLRQPPSARWMVTIRTFPPRFMIFAKLSASLAGMSSLSWALGGSSPAMMKALRMVGRAA